MEDALARIKKVRVEGNERVLILVVMEDALAQGQASTKKRETKGLNPCCNGRCTRTPEC